MHKVSQMLHYITVDFLLDEYTLSAMCFFSFNTQDSEVKQNFLDPLYLLETKEIKEINVRITLSLEKKTSQFWQLFLNSV